MILCENLVKIYKTSEIEVVALQGLDMTVEDGELMAIIGNSGSGKSTLLNMLGGLDRPSAGRLEVDGRDLLKFTEREYVDYKRNVVGFVWQNNARNLLPYMTARENIELPMLLAHKYARAHARDLLELVGLSHRSNHKLAQLSGGEQQLVAIALALSNSPKLLLADEPTGAVDAKTASRILNVLRDINKQLGVTIVIVTHDRELSRKVDRVVTIRDGITSSEMLRKISYAEEIASLESGLLTEAKHEQEEFVLVDNSGRVQIPLEMLNTLGISGKGNMRAIMEDGNIVLSPGEQKTTVTQEGKILQEDISVKTRSKGISRINDLIKLKFNFKDGK